MTTTSMPRAHEADGLVARGVDDVADHDARDAELDDRARAHEAGLQGRIHRRVVPVGHAAGVAHRRHLLPRIFPVALSTRTPPIGQPPSPYPFAASSKAI
jgi:hypothetical protein